MKSKEDQDGLFVLEEKRSRDGRDTHKCKCGKRGEEGTCPYDEDVHNTRTECSCCKKCRRNCLLDI